MRKEICCNCYYCSNDGDFILKDLGCHRYPPTIDSKKTVFPKVGDYVWCGEFKPKETNDE